MERQQQAYSYAVAGRETARRTAYEYACLRPAVWAFLESEHRNYLHVEEKAVER